MAKYLDGTGLGTVWEQIKSVFLSKSGGTMTGTITTSEGNHAGLKIGSTYITSAGTGNVVFQNNTTGIRFGADAWDYNQWAGLKYVHSSKIIYLGLADGSVFTANTAQSGGKLYTPGIDQICVGNGTYTVYHTGNLPAYPTKDSWNYDDRYLKLTGGTLTGNLTATNSYIKAGGDGLQYPIRITRAYNNSVDFLIGSASSEAGSNDALTMRISNNSSGGGGEVYIDLKNSGGGVNIYPSLTVGGYGVITSNNIGSQSVSTSVLTQYQRRDNFIQSPKGGTFTTSNSTYTGYLRIKLPCGMLNTMLSFFVDIYDYSLNCSVTYKIAGYSYSGGWVRCTAQCVSSYEGSYSDLSIRFGTLDGNAAVEIGESNTSWSYPQVLVRDFVFGYSNATVANYFDSWTIDFSTTSITLTTYGGDYAHSEFLNKGLKAKYAASAGSVAWSNITGKPSAFDSALTNSDIDAICT